MSVKLKRMHEGALQKVLEWRMMPSVTQYMYTDPKLTLEDQQKWFEKIQSDPSVRYWLIEVDGTEIGVINLVDIDYVNLRCCWAYYIADISFRGRGLGKILECNMYDYVFETLGQNKLWCEVFTFNEGVIHIHQRFGSEIEGTLKQHICKNGKFYDIVRMGILRDKWQNTKGKFSYEKIEIE
ncbi:UDP-4-amino-4,6-dideoxy-N-acetyl-beta-L-altrosamine N-acetyltransferase [Sporomusa aerivorans]|uniref:UDP-4-amino-4, 6-dideoxy-N-acetyl-beta-L-altrosamine N-acetyltransferase n=1 Tax=Sporomusa aerivorans TaxID=204936 RepID=UPI00352A1F61